MAKSVVVSIRVSSEVYDMLCFVANSRKERYAKLLKLYGPVGCSSEDVSPTGVAKSILINAIGKEYAEERNR